ncbi:MAG: LacI family DNA-binding transcriptional regulator [Verrucomicrobia bacterium]|jgi:DNA-binding LacI/PurR family transcriptional regulator|nr:LacI family DNA-binding transcriptional regulator [Verrucomicrobiota bacterium]
MPTIDEIARLAGVSIGTVSRVINKRDKVRPETRERIQALIDQLGYQPSAAARNLASRRTQSIMLIVPNVTDNYYARLIRRMLQLGREHDQRIWLGVSDGEPDVEARYLSEAHEGNVDGLIVSSLLAEENTPHFLALAHRKFPVVHMSNECLNPRMNAVIYDDIAGAKLAMQHLFDKGHTRIAFCGATAHFRTVRERIRGYRESMAQAGYPVDPAWLLVTETRLEEWPWENFDNLFGTKPPPTAIFAENDVMAIACLRRLRASSRHIPEDVAVVGFDNTYPRHAVEQPLTTIALPLSDACRTAMEILLKEIGQPKEERTGNTVKMLPPSLVVGKTT